MPQYNFILAGRAGVGKTQLFNYIKTGIAPKHDPDYADDSRTTMTPLGDTGLERLEHETFVNGRQVKVALAIFAKQLTEGSNTKISAFVCLVNFFVCFHLCIGKPVGYWWTGAL